MHGYLGGMAGDDNTRETVTGAAGLSTVEAAARLAEVGPNAIPEPKPRSVASRVGQQLRDPMILLLLGAGVVVALLRDYADMIIIAAVVVLNTSIGVAQEVRSERAIAALRRLAAPHATVLRDGTTSVIPAAEVVPGDVVLVEAGDVVPADVVLTEAQRLQADEAALTGESVPVDKEVGAQGDTAALRAGTVITRGRGRGVVTATGPRSAMGRIAAMIADQPVRPTPLQRRLSALARLLTITVSVIGVIVIVLGMVQGRSLAEMVVVAVSLAVAAVPESMPAVVALALALGAYRMARRFAVVRRLPAVETLGSVTLIAADKTGTLTEGRMRAEAVWTPSASYRVSGTGYEPGGTLRLVQAVRPDGTLRESTALREGTALRECVAPEDAPELVRLMRDVALCNDAQVLPPTGEDTEWRPVGDPQEAALVVLAETLDGSVAELRARHPRYAEVPFDSHRRRMTTAHETPDGAYLVVCKGAPEVLANLRLSYPAGLDAAAVARAAQEMAAEGYRVLAVADRTSETRPALDELERGLRFVGLVGIVDPVRRGVEEVAEAFRRAGVRLALVTGDHPATASVIAARVGLPHDRVVNGSELDEPDDGSADVRDVHVFARIRPEQKLGLIRGWQERGEVVAMTGDGVNDAPALRHADIGVAMGAGGTEVARQAADLILLDDDLGTVASAIEEGRRIYANVRRFLTFGLSGGLAEILVMVFGPLLGHAVPLFPGQILWINLLTHGLPGVAMGAEPSDRGTMLRPPRSPRETVLGGGLWRQVVILGVLIALVAAAAGWLISARGGPWRPAVFVVLGLAQLGVGLALRSRARHDGRVRFLALALPVAAVLQVLPLYVSWLQDLLRVQPLGAEHLAIGVAFAALPGLVLTVWRLVTKR